MIPRPPTEYIATRFGHVLVEWYRYLPPSGRMIVHWKRDRAGIVWYAVYRAG